MRLAVISDTHMTGTGSRRLPERCVEIMRGCDVAIHAGDIMTAEALIEIEAVGPPVRAITGNMDGWELRVKLPDSQELELDGVRIAMVHDGGSAKGRLARLRQRFPDAAAVVFGHSHIPLHEQEGGFQIFNPGSPTERRRSPHHSMGVAEIAGGAVSFELIVLD
jgi:putative phosphoesterase